MTQIPRSLHQPASGEPTAAADQPVSSETLSYRALELPAETEALTDFLCGETWPWHSGSRLSREQVRQRLAEGAYSGSDKQSFWILAGGERIGLVKLFDLDDIGNGYPLFDLRVRAAWRGRGIGEQAVRWLTRYLFETWPILERIEATTRADNLAMRKVLLRCGYAKEGHYRKAWDGYGSVHYGILREDWETGTVTPVPWDDQAGLA